MQMVPVPPGNMSYSRSYKIGIEDLDQVGIGDLSEVWNYYGQTSQQEPNVVCKHMGIHDFCAHRGFWILLTTYAPPEIDHVDLNYNLPLWYVGAKCEYVAQIQLSKHVLRGHADY